MTISSYLVGTWEYIQSLALSLFNLTAYYLGGLILVDKLYKFVIRCYYNSPLLIIQRELRGAGKNPKELPRDTSRKVELPEWKRSIIREFKKGVKAGKKLFFIHIPKTGGTYATAFCRQFKIRTKLTNITQMYARYPAVKEDLKDHMTFSIIRDPAKRYQSALKDVMRSWMRGFTLLATEAGLFGMIMMRLDRVLFGMSNADLFDKYFKPKLVTGFDYSWYKDYSYWTKNVQLCLTIKEFIPFMEEMGYEVDREYAPQNVSPKIGGNLTDAQMDWIRNTMVEDVRIWNYWSRNDIN